MKIYLASRYSRRSQLCEIRDELVRMGHVVTSRWLDTEWDRQSPDGSSAAPPEYRREYAEIDLQDVSAADVVANFTEKPGLANAGRGGRHVEFGYALALGKQVVVIGHRENLFHEHPSVVFFDSHWEWMRSLHAVAG